MGRPKGSTKLLTPAVTEAVCESLRKGIAEKWSALAAKITEDNFHEWMRQGRAGHKPYEAFFQACTYARAQGVLWLHERAFACDKDATSALWMLERQFRSEYGPPRSDPEKQEGKITVENAIRERECQQ